MKNIKHYIVLALAAGHLAACQTTGDSTPDTEKPLSRSERFDAAVEQTVIHASKNMKTSAALRTLEKKYKRNPEDPATALAYAKGLRQEGRLKHAAIVLESYTSEDPVPAGINTEISMLQLTAGEYDMAEKYAQNAILQNELDYEAYQNLGIALDAKEMHAEAERAFRKGLEHWQGNPTTIMNNLALNLATQGRIDEAIEVLERAKALSPDRIELERNLRIIRTLNERE